VSDAQLNEVITNGRNKSMPAWKNKLSPEEINALVARVREFGKKN
jgi:mono/diheme cytochrome c family protein